MIKVNVDISEYDNHVDIYEGTTYIDSYDENNKLISQIQIDGYETTKIIKDIIDKMDSFQLAEIDNYIHRYDGGNK